MFTTESCQTTSAIASKLGTPPLPITAKLGLNPNEFTIWGFPAYTLRQLPGGKWEVINTKRGRALKLFMRNGYLSVNLTDKFGESHALYLHRIIRQTLDCGDKAAYVGFRDGDRLNLQEDNLIWSEYHPATK
jgi:hypothetical protein